MGHHWISCLILASCTGVVQFLLESLWGWGAHNCKPVFLQTVSHLILDLSSSASLYLPPGSVLWDKGLGMMSAGSASMGCVNRKVGRCLDELLSITALGWQVFWGFPQRLEGELYSECDLLSLDLGGFLPQYLTPQPFSPWCRLFLGPRTAEDAEEVEDC